MDNLYEGKEYFLLRIDGAESPIDEPIGWDAIYQTLKRDPDLYGFNIEFVDGADSLKFAFGGGGGELLLDRYEEKGSDGAVEFEFGLVLSATRDPQLVATVNLNDCTDDTEGVSCAIERTTFESKLRTRYDTKVTLTDTKNLDGNLIDRAPSVNLQLHSKTIIRQTEAKNEFPAFVFLDPNLAGAPYGYSPKHWILPDTEEKTTSELGGVQSMPLAILDHDPTIDSLFQYQAEEAGYLEIYFDWYAQGGTYRTAPNVIQSGIDGMFESDTPYGPNANRWNTYVWLERGTDVIHRESKPAVNPSHNLLLANTFWLQVEINDKVYVGIEVEHTQNKKGAYTDTWKNTLRFRQLTTAARSNAKAYRIIDLLNHLVLSVTGQSSRILSSYFAPGGQGYNYAVTSGYALRKFDVVANKPVQADLKSTITSLQAIFNIGMSFEQVGDEMFIRIEPMATFFNRGNVVFELQDVYDWRDYHDKDVTYNEVIIGFEKYATDQSNSMDDAHTEQTWLLPITTYKKQLVKKSKLIASAFMIENQRREQYKTNPSTSLAEDDSLFIVACTDTIEYLDLFYEYDEIAGTITFGRPLGLIVGDIIRTPESGLNTGAYHVVAINYEKANSYSISGPVFTSSDIATVQISQVVLGTGPAVYAERNQAFSQLENSIDPAGSYNLRITPHRNLYALAPLLNICLEKKDSDAVIRNTFSKNNGALQSRLSVGLTNGRLEGTRLVQESADIVVADFERLSAPYSPRRSEFKARVPYSWIARLAKALRGEGAPYENYGQIVAPDKNGIPWLCVVQAVKYTYASEVAEFTVNKVERY